MSSKSMIRQNENTKSKVLLIPGFLTEPITSKMMESKMMGSQNKSPPKNQEKIVNSDLFNAFDSIDPTKVLDARGWQIEVRKMIDMDQCQLNCFDWASQNLIELIAQSTQLIYQQRNRLSFNLIDVAHSLGFNIYQTWKKAILQADQSVERLYQQISTYAEEDPHSPIYVIGHSLGGRIALRLAMMLAQQPIEVNVKISSWAPAIDQSDLDWQGLSMLDSPPEIFYTENDLILKYLYKLGQTKLSGIKTLDGLTLMAALAQQSRAVGLIGADPSYETIHQHGLEDTSIGHLTYLSEMPIIFKKSNYLKELQSKEIQ